MSTQSLTHEHDDGRERDRVQGLADGQRRRRSRPIDAAQRSPQPLHSYTLPVVSESGKQSESAKQLAAAEQQAKERFEKAMTELREGAYRFSSRARGQSELIIEELIDPEGETVASLAEVEGEPGALALAQSLELITFDTWLFGQIGDKDALDLKAEEHWEVWFTFGAWIGETMRRRHGGHWLMMGDDPHTWRIGFSKIFLEIAPFVFAEQLLRMGSGATAQDGHRDRAHPAAPRRAEDGGQRRSRSIASSRSTTSACTPCRSASGCRWTSRASRSCGTRRRSRRWSSDQGEGPRLGPQNAQIVEQVVAALAAREAGRSRSRSRRTTAACSRRSRRSSRCAARPRRSRSTSSSAS